MDKIKETISSIFDFFQGIVVFMAMLVMVYLFLFSPQEINGQSMFPTFYDKELLITNKIVYKLNKPKRGDIVIFKSPRNKEIDYIKRVIGLPGDEVTLNWGDVPLADFYEVEVVKDGGAPVIIDTTDSLYVMPYEPEGLASAQVRVRGCNNLVCGDYSSPVSFMYQ